MIRTAYLAAGALAIYSVPLMLAMPARAQFNPFHGARNVPPLTREDYRLLNESARKLNADAQAHAGQFESWTNPASGASGHVLLTRVFQSGGMPCHAMEYTIAVRKRSGSRTVNLTWCRTPSGDWKIKS